MVDKKSLFEHKLKKKIENESIKPTFSDEDTFQVKRPFERKNTITDKIKIFSQNSDSKNLTKQDVVSESQVL